MRGQLHEARKEARIEAIVFALAALGLLVTLSLTSKAAGWELLGVGWWIWLPLAIPHVLLILGEIFGAAMEDDERRRRFLLGALALVALANVAGLAVLVAALLTEETSDLSGAQLLMSGISLWLANIIVFGLTFWAVDGGGPIHRAKHHRAQKDFQFPQDENPNLVPPGWYPRLEDYVYVGLTNAIAFSPTDSMPLTRQAKALMAMESVISAVALLLVAARAVNVLQS